MAVKSAETIIECVCISCAEKLCKHSVPMHRDGYRPGKCDVCGRPTLVADPQKFGGFKASA